MSEGSPTVSFRLEEEQYSELVRSAAKAGAESPNLHARRMLSESLAGDSRLEEIAARIFTIEGQVAELRTDFATAVHVLLMAAHHPDPSATRSDVTAWVAKNLRSH